MKDYSNRHPATQQILRWLCDLSQIPPGLALDVADVISVLAREMADALPDGPELTTGLRKLLESRECFVRAAIDVMEARS